MIRVVIMDSSSISSEVTMALRVVMNPLSDPEQRRNAHKACEEFKEHPMCVPCGFALSSKENDPIVRHYGLQLIEHNIKLKWNNFSSDEKQYIKNTIMQILMNGTNPILNEHGHIKDLLSRIIVEMIKREWPQQWPNLLEELNEACTIGEAQTELVLLTFRRLGEDIPTGEGIPTQRRREIQQVLSLHMEELFSFFLKTLSDNNKKYMQLVILEDENMKQQAFVHCKLVDAALKTLAGFVEWVSWPCITANNNVLLEALCTLLSHDHFKHLAIDCLLSIVDRKGKLEDRRPLLVLFNEDAMSVIFAASRITADTALASEQNYIFFKKLCQLLVNLGIQLALLWKAVADITEPSTFQVYLKSILSFMSHPSLWLNEHTLALWLNFLQHPIISKNGHVRLIIPSLVELLPTKLVKVRFSMDQNTFMKLDFDNENDFRVFMTTFRSKVVVVLMHCTQFLPEICFKCGAQMLISTLQSSNDSIMLASMSFPLQLQLDALASYMEPVCSRLYQDNNLNLCPEGVNLLKLTLQFRTDDIDVLSSLLSCMSALFVYFTLDPQLMLPVLDRIFDTIALPLPDETTQDIIGPVRDCQRHASACFIKIAREHPKLLLPSFDHICEHVMTLVRESRHVFNFSKCMMMEALMMISNEIQDYNKQSALLQNIIQGMTTSWSMLVKDIFSVQDFVQFLLTSDISSEKGEDRNEICYCLDVILGLIRRCKWPSDLNVAEKGGYVVKEGNNQYLQNPATPHFLPLTGGILLLIRNINSLYKPEAMSLLPAGYSCILAMPEAEEKIVLGSVISCSEVHNNNLPHTRMRKFIYFRYETCLQILGNACQHLKHQFYALPELSSSIHESILNHLEHLPDFKLRAIFHFLLKPLFQSCPPSYFTIVTSILEVLCPFMLEKLSTTWRMFKEQYGTSDSCENEMTETQEMLTDQLNRLLSREYIDLLACALKSKSVDFTSDAMDEDDETKIQSKSAASDCLSPLGIMLLRTEKVNSFLVWTLFNSIRWSDTAVCLRSTLLCSTVFEQLKKDSFITTESHAALLLYSALFALTEHGQHEANQGPLVSLCLNIYESLRPTFPNLKNVLITHFSCPVDKVKQFDSVILSEQKKPVPEKKKRESFRQVIADAIGKNVGQFYKNDIQIKNLPTLFLPPRQKNIPLDEQKDENHGLCSLFTGDSCIV